LARYRLRLLLQEIDLPLGETVLGRSSEANLTIEDPLVSRLHARIVIDEQGGRLEDLESRNGVRVNGVLIRGSTRLNDGDRLRLGTQDIVFCQVEQAPPRANKTTGVLRLCANCRQPYPREMVACPNCEATEQMEEQTLQGEEPSHDKGVWGTQLLVEALERAITHGRTPDAERIVRRATAELDAHLATGGVIDGKTLASLSTHALAVSMATGDAVWALWVVDVYRRTSRVPSLPVVRGLGQLAAKHGPAMRTPIARLVDHIRLPVGEGVGSAAAAPAEGDALSRLDEIHRILERVPSGEPEPTDPDATLDVAGHWSDRR
jgi:hypothetical protein